MIIIFESILPIFLLVALGVGLKRAPFIAPDQWNGLEAIGYYVLFPALLFSTLAEADFAGMKADATGIATIGSVTLMSACVLAAWPAFRARGVDAAAFTSVFQTATRWNGFIALAAANTLYGPLGLTLTAFVMTLVIIPINVYNVAVLVRFRGNGGGLGMFVLRIVSNPMIVAAVLGMAVNASGLTVYAPLMSTVDMLGDASLAIGLVLVGAGLRVLDAVRPSRVAMIAVGLKLIVMPVFMVGSAYALGIRGDSLLVIALGASVPTAMNGYILAKQMGGDAPLYAAVATVQTVLSFFTIPLVLGITGYFAAG